MKSTKYLEEDEIQLQRYHRIVKYLSNNYMNKVSLKDIADKEFLSSQYLSYKIKDTFGLGFNEYLNQIRVEESTKLLLDTDKSIAEISDEVGFSHVRYFNRNFKLHYKSTPLQYRKKHNLDRNKLESLKEIEYFPIEESLPYLKRFLEGYERYSYDNRIRKIDIDLKKESKSKFIRPEVIDLGDISLLSEEGNKNILRQIQSGIGFKYALVKKLFSSSLNIYKGANDKFINWTRVENIIGFLLEVKLFPIIDINGVEKHIVEDFIENFSNIFQIDASTWLNFPLKDLNLLFLEKDIDDKYDTMEMVPFIINSYVSGDRKIVFKMIDEIDMDTVLSNDTFFGGGGLYTNNYLNKPSYYAFILLSLMGKEILYREEDYVVTKLDEDYQILLFNSSNESRAKNISINLYNMECDYHITKFNLNKNYGSSFDKWQAMGSPKRIENKYWKLLKKCVHPDINFNYGKKSLVFNLLVELKSESAIIFILKAAEIENRDNLKI